MTPQVLVTGAGGFVGRAVVDQLISAGRFEVRASVRHSPVDPVEGAQYLLGGSLESLDSWHSALDGVDTLIHTAGRAHVLRDITPDPLFEFREVNAVGTVRLAEQAAAAGVRRFVFISSIGVNGVLSSVGKAFAEVDLPNPHNAYSLSKWEAERGLMLVAARTPMEVVIIRSPMVYGPGAPGNFGLLLKVVAAGWPLPLGAVRNKRSLVALDNLADFILRCVEHPYAANQTFMVSDGEDVSTADLIRRMTKAMEKRERLFSVPVWALQLGAKLTGNASALQRLAGTLQVDIAKAKNLLGWKPPIGMDEGLWRAAAQWRKQ